MPICKDEMEKRGQEAARASLKELAYYAEHGKFSYDYKPNVLYQICTEKNVGVSPQTPPRGL